MTDKTSHVPVLLDTILKAVAPVSGRWVDGTLGAGGYTRALLRAGADQVIAIDRDPLAHTLARAWAGGYGSRLKLVQARFSEMAGHAGRVEGVVLDLGVSSMQLDKAERGFSFGKDGPLDMRMSQDGPSAADLVNTATEKDLSSIFWAYGEERAARRIAKAIVTDRVKKPFQTTAELANLVQRLLPPKKPGQSHPATRTFQALRIAVNDEFGELIRGLVAAETILKPHGWLAVVSFHSLEDRLVKRFLALRADTSGGVSRHAPERDAKPASFVLKPKRAIAPTAQEVLANTRARSARLRLARRTDAPAHALRQDDHPVSQTIMQGRRQ